MVVTRHLTSDDWNQDFPSTRFVSYRRDLSPLSSVDSRRVLSFISLPSRPLKTLEGESRAP